MLHRHFADFDAFLAELVLGRVQRLDAVSAGLRAAAGSGSVTDHLTGALAEVFDAVGVAVVSLVIARDELRARLRASGSPAGVPLLTEAAAVLAAYLAAERDLGRVAPGADPAVLAPTLLGAAHLLYADRESPAPDASAVRAVVATVMAAALR